MSFVYFMDWFSSQKGSTTCSRPERPFHFMHVAVKPSECEDGVPRPVDDWEPRANITKLFTNRNISLQKQDEITTLSNKFYVKRDYVVTCIEHLTNLQLCEQTWARTREEEQNNKYDEYDWLILVLQREFNKLKVHELNKYIIENKINRLQSQQMSCKRAIPQPLNIFWKTSKQQEQNGSDSEICDSESDQELVLEVFGSESETESEQQQQILETVPLVIKKHYGWHAGNWALSQLK